EDDDDDEEREQLVTGRPDDLLQLGDHLADEQRDPREEATLLRRPRTGRAAGTLGPARRARGLTHRRSSSLVWVSGPGSRLDAALAGQEGLEPTTAGFGDRCATNCATALRDFPPPGRPVRAPLEAVERTVQPGGDQPPGNECTRLRALGRTRHVVTLVAATFAGRTSRLS